ncbi:MAG: transposase [Clostridia bacterium]|nr:transposase [Clostridia bacterium]
MEKDLLKRKPLRIPEHNYSSSGAYFITICTEKRKNILSEIITVGDGAYDVPKTELTNVGRIVEKHLLSSENIKGVKIDKYVIMPNHIHAIIILVEDEYLSENKSGTSRAPSPTNEMLPHIISSFKRFCNKEIGYNIFQRSFHDHIIRNRRDYEEIVKYICENPDKWFFDELYAENE